MYITFASANKAEPTLALKPKGENIFILLKLDLSFTKIEKESYQQWLKQYIVEHLWAYFC